MLAGRVNPGLPEDELRGAVECVRDLVGESFLRDSGWHPLRELWQRRDHIATSELFWLGSCLKTLACIDHDWVMETVPRIKLPQHGRTNRTGFMFELLGLGSFAIGGHQVHPAANSTAGYDGTIFLDDGREVRVSLKNFGPTDNQILFERESKKTQDLLLEWATSQRRSWIGISITADVFPKIADWYFLRLELPEFLREEAPHKRIADIWLVSKLPPADSPNGLARRFLSYTILVTAPLGKSEARGFRNKIFDALKNLEKNAMHFPSGVHPVVLAKVSTAASMAECISSARKFLESPGVRTSSIFLYQSAIAGNPNTRKDAIHHNMSVVSRSTATDPFSLKFSLPVGVVSANPSRSELHAGSTVVNLDQNHTHFESRLYDAYPLDEQGNGQASSWTLSPGLARLGVLRLPTGEELLIQPPYPPRPDLALFL